jgi:hypothetical protein
MPSIVLKVTQPAPDAGEHSPPESAGPLFRGNGDTDCLCGQCAFVIVSGIGPTQHVSVESTTCPSCGAVNEFPPNLRS